VSVPCCIWRRTGEIVRTNGSFCQLVGLSLGILNNSQLHGTDSPLIYIYDLLEEESHVHYWEKYAAIAFDSNQKAVLTCALLKTFLKPLLPTPLTLLSIHTSTTHIDTQLPSGPSVYCGFSFTLKRDPYGIPCMIVGHFIPIPNTELVE
jgi:hypothetical protein